MVDVAIVCGAGIVSGKETMALELGQGLREAGLSVHFLTSYWGNGDFAGRTETEGFPTSRLWLGFISATLHLDCIWMTAVQFGRWPSLLAGYRRFVAKTKPARVIHTNWHHGLLMWPLLQKERDIYWVHEVFPSKRQYRGLFSALAKRVGGFVAVSNVVAKSLIDLGVPINNVQVIHNGLIDPTVGFPGHNLNVGSTIGIAGQIGAWKGHEDLVQALRIVVRSFPTAQLHIFGKGSEAYEEFLRSCVADAGLAENVKWRGFVSDRAKIYREMSVIAIPSKFDDPLPTSAIEAAFFEVPVVASRRGGLPEIVEDGVTGFLFEPGNVYELAQYLRRLLADSDLRTRMGKSARERAMSRFNRDRLVREFCEVLRLGERNGATTDVTR